MRIISFLCVCVLLAGCSKQSSKDIVDQFPIEVNVVLNEIEIEPVLYFVGDMLIVDDILVTLDMKNDTFFQFFSLPELTYLGGQVSRGEGPEEEFVIFPTLDNVGNNNFSYRTMQKIKIASFDKNRKALNVEREIVLPDKYMSIMNSFVMNDRVFGYDMLGKSKQEFISYNSTKKEISEFGASHPIVNMDIEDDKKNTLFTKIMAGKSDGTKFASLYDKFPILRIYDDEGKIINEVEYNNKQRLPIAYTHKEMLADETKDLTINYLKVKVTDKYIYGLYSGKTHGELQTAQRQVNDYCVEVHVWDWTGKAIARYILDNPVSGFAVALDDSYMLFYSFNSENKLYKSTCH